MTVRDALYAVIREQSNGYAKTYAAYALRLVNNLRNVYGHRDMPKMLSDFVFSIEVALQNAGVLDEGFNETYKETSK